MDMELNRDAVFGSRSLLAPQLAPQPSGVLRREAINPFLPRVLRTPPLFPEADEQETSAGGMLSGASILVIEDDYFLALSTKEALRRAGAAVVGPHHNEDSARRAMRNQRVSAAVMDIMLGDGPCYALATELAACGVPVLFVTGYERHQLPGTLALAAVMTKPVEPGDIVSRLSTMLAGMHEAHDIEGAN
ncbi:response regulator transcription factor [Rhodovarius crocodyli]|uniref:Response regulator transcription factor n=1 Tax=Rhodovarius crocodyli TaxID=1979269 RepID=A0A437MDS0_9PROT|nr:response regulator [Rhodovarius crocodyli]RVT95804.1 response regulator transcription factor [Rhodovarius crocodyli]